MRKNGVLAVLLVLAFVLAFAADPGMAPAQQQASSTDVAALRPSVDGFRFVPDAIRAGGEVQFTFAYANFPGGLAAIRDVEMWVDWQRPQDRAVRSRLVPTTEELAAHPEASGEFKSRSFAWRPPEQVPSGGVEVKYTIVLRLRDAAGKKLKIERDAILRAFP